jgi:periplasmic divalent cation tolerance protein
MRDDAEFILVFSTCPDREVAERLAFALVERRLAACVSILPGLHSVYRWQGATECSDEQLLLIKSRGSSYRELERALKELHPYELPEIVAVPISDGLPAYLAWIKGVMEEKP